MKDLHICKGTEGEKQPQFWKRQWKFCQLSWHKDSYLNLLLNVLRVLLRHPFLIWCKHKGIKINNRKFRLCRQCKIEQEKNLLSLRVQE